MRKARRIVVYIAISADGYIARPDGDVGWLDRPQPKGNYDMGKFLKSIDTILWGHKTYQKAIEVGMKAGGFGPGIQHYVFSRTPQESSEPKVKFVSDPVDAFAQRLRRQRGTGIWMMGGAQIIASFLDAGEIDEFRIHVIPILIGEGIPLIQPRHRSVRLKLQSTKRFPDGVVRLDYRVVARS